MWVISEAPVAYCEALPSTVSKVNSLWKPCNITLRADLALSGGAYLRRRRSLIKGYGRYIGENLACHENSLVWRDEECVQRAGFHSLRKSRDPFLGLSTGGSANIRSRGMCLAVFYQAAYSIWTAFDHHLQFYSFFVP